jgi:hypothetical protein
MKQALGHGEKGHNSTARTDFGNRIQLFPLGPYWALCGPGSRPSDSAEGRVVRTSEGQRP